MKKLYEEFFQITKFGKIREKVMVTRLVSSTVIVLFCLFFMSLTAYAYFTYDTSSEKNVIKAATFELFIQVTDENGNAAAVTENRDRSQTLSVLSGKTYTVVLKHSENSSAQTGFAILRLKDRNGEFHTAQIGRNDDGTTKEITFQIQSPADTEVTFFSRWGTSSLYPSHHEQFRLDDNYVQDEETLLAMEVETQEEEAATEETKAPEKNTPPTSTTKVPVTSTEAPPATTTPPITEAETAPEATTPPETTVPPVSTEEETDA